MHFDWRYTHFVTEDLFVNVIVHDTCMFGFYQNPYVSFCIWYNGKIQHQRFEFSTDQYTEIKQSICRIGSNKQFGLSLGELTIAGELTKKYVAPTMNYQIYKTSDYDISHWDIVTAHAIFTGQITYAGYTVPCEAVVYQDHQYGSLPVQMFLDKWIWRVESSPLYTNCCFSFSFQNGEKKTISWRIDDRGFSHSSSEQFEQGIYDSLFSSPEYICLRTRKAEEYEFFILNYSRYLSRNDSLTHTVSECMSIERR